MNPLGYYSWQLQKTNMNEAAPRVVILHAEDGSGKTTIAKRFCTRYHGRYFSFHNLESTTAMKLFSPECQTWQDFFQRLCAKEKRPAIVFDDVDERNDKEEFLKALCESVNKKLFVVLCCRKAISLSCPTRDMPIARLSTAEVQSIAHCEDRMDTLRLRVITDGIPELVYLYDPDRSFLENIGAFFTPGSAYLRYAERRLRQEFRSPESYNTLLCGMGMGNHRNNELSAFSGFPKNKVDKYLDSLNEVGLILKLPCICDNRQERMHYFIKGYYWRFIYDYWFPNQMQYWGGVPTDVLQTWIQEIDEGDAMDFFQKMAMWWVDDFAFRDLLRDQRGLNTPCEYSAAVDGITFDMLESTKKYTLYLKTWTSTTEPFPKSLYEQIEKATTRRRPFFMNHYFFASIQPIPRFLITLREKYPNIHAIDLKGLIWNRGQGF